MDLWHRRLSHLHYRSLPSLRKVVTGLLEFEEAFTGEKPEIGHLRFFGCPVYIHVPRERRTKLDPYGRKGVFVGYSESAKA